MTTRRTIVMTDRVAPRLVPGWGWTVLMSAALGTGCYQGRSDRFDAPQDIVDDEQTEDESDPNDDERPDAHCSEDELGPSTLRRLTREQYNNTVHDLLGLEGDHAFQLDDSSVGPFRANPTPVDDLTVDRYVELAETLAAQAVQERLPALLPCEPAGDGELECGERFVAEFGARALRHPLDTEELAVYRELFESTLEEDGFEAGIARVVEAMLASPMFLYHQQLGDPDDAPGEVVHLTGHEIASRLSYFLWQTMPDDELRARAPDLRDAVVLREQAERMLDDPRGKAAIASFHLQWLGVDDLWAEERNTEIFEGFGPELKTAMVDEFVRFADYVIRFDDARLQTLLTAPYLFPTGPLAELYGVPAAAEADEPVASDPSRRAGLLTLAGFSARHAAHERTDPVSRGVVLRKAVLCETPPPPPPDVETDLPPPEPGESAREHLERHQADPVCAGCHVLFDPLGLAFEHYDAVGRFRELEDDEPIDASGKLVAGSDSLPFDDAIELSGQLAEYPQVHDCVVRQWLTFGLGRIPVAEDACGTEAIAETFATSGQDIRELVLGLVTSRAFSNRRSQ